MYRDLEDFWDFSRRYRLFQRISSLSHELLDKDHTVSERSRDALERLNRERIACQQKIAGLDLPSFARCADCKGACCRKPSEHYFTAIDYWLRRHTPHEVQGYAGGGAVPLHCYFRDRIGTACKRLLPPSAQDPPPPPPQDCRCSHLGDHGCRLPHAERPLKCLIYACPDLKRSLDHPTRRAYIKEIKELQQIAISTFNVLKHEAGVPSSYGIPSLLLTL
jgi:Fe-S-cluster containining protein